ncbi:TetR/AcrR family transcriptional regulator [Streptococcus halotolerans]|uniref:TetR/AcrR family transcriptional regulator n=1 Tax=Streptococcus halotolerans TaxID=1814128 RepID=UPI000786C4D7|nr:TetR/AcrR family transcriptional regulator [Streptococcus halotolerans]
MTSPHQTLTKSQRYLIDAFIKLLDEKSPADIRIIDILNVSGVSRTTFYNYFDSKESLIDFCLSAYIDHITLILNQDLAYPDQVVVDALTFLKEHSNYTRALVLYYPNIDQIVTNYITKMTDPKHSSIDHLNAKLKEGYHFSEKYLLSIYVMTIKTIIFVWVKNDFKETPSEVTAILKTAVQNLTSF